MRLDQILGKVVSSMTKQFFRKLHINHFEQPGWKREQNYGQIKQLLHSNDFLSTFDSENNHRITI